MADAGKGSWFSRLGSLGGRTLAVLAVIAVLVAAADRSGLVLDLSADRRFTLSERLVRILAGQDQAVELVSIWSADEEGAFEPVRTALERMATVSPRVTHRHLDPELQKPLLAAFAERHREAQPRSLYVVRGERVFKIALGERSRLYLQRDVGGALLTLAEPTPPAAWLLQGHGELRPGGGGEDGGDQLTHLLSLAGFQVEAVTPARSADPRADGVLVVAGPTAPLGARDLRLLGDHLRDGGSALVAVDDRCPADLGAWLRLRGLAPGPARPQDPGAFFAPDAACQPPMVLVSMRRHLAGQEVGFPHHNLLIEAANPQHQATRALAQAGVPLLLPWSVTVDPLPPEAFGDHAGEAARAFVAAGTQPFAAEALLTTAPGDTWAKPRAAPLAAPDDLARAPARAVAAAAEYQPAADSVRAGAGARLVVVGSRQAFSDAVLAQTHFANAELVRGAVAWLARRGVASDIPTAEVASFQVRCGDGGLSLVLVLLLAVMPCLCIGSAMLTWWDRR
ncbi:MAG: GldG family protein [Planctomycetes bacterium]|nr:GldG family protein [Planctomycetota bacterium]